MLVCALGDLLLDVIVRVQGSLVAGGDVPASVDVVPGGQAANVAAWVAALGGRGRWVGRHGDDVGARLALEALQRLGAEACGPVASGRGGAVVSLVDERGERTMASDRGIAAGLAAAELEPAWFACDHLHVSGYVLSDADGREAAQRGAELARAAGAAVSVDLAAATLVEEVGRQPLRDVLARIRPDAVFCNEDEDAAVGGRLAGPTWIVKRGARGASFDGVERAAVPAAQVVDATGAGDAFAAGWIVGGPGLALEAAARCVAQVGAMPAA